MYLFNLPANLAKYRPRTKHIQEKRKGTGTGVLTGLGNNRTMETACCIYQHNWAFFALHLILSVWQKMNSFLLSYTKA